MDLDQYVEKVKTSQMNGHDLANMVKEGLLSKAERRKIAKLAQKEELTERQKLRLAVKEKKALPKMTKEDRKRKFGKDLDDEREMDEANFTICLGCRKRGHFVKDCPKLAMIPNTVPVTAPEVCFNCGSAEHTLKNCPKGREQRSLKFANCFICKQQGHIARDCPENANGLYPNGGCCHICLQKTHLVRDCPERTEEDKQAALLRKQKAEDDEKGVRVKGLTADSHDNSRGGDDIMIDDGDRDDSGDEDRPTKKAKKSKSDKPKKKKHDK